MADQLCLRVRAKDVKNVGADQSARFGGIMRCASNPHGVDRRVGKSRGISVSCGATQGAPLAIESAAGAPAQKNLRVLFEIPATPLPTPQPKKRRGGNQLHNRKPWAGLKRRQGASPARADREPAQNRLIFIVRGSICFGECCEIRGYLTGVHSDLDSRNGQIDVIAANRIKIAERYCGGCVDLVRERNERVLKN